MAKRILVTGGAGFIGANFVRYYREEHPDDYLLVIDLLTYAGNLANLHGIADIEFVKGDIGDQALVEELLREHRIDTIVYFAAESHVDRSISGPDVFVETNIIGTHNLLKAARQVWLLDGQYPDHRFHHVSTDEVYGSLQEGEPAFTENHPYAPNSPYSASKASSDHLVRAYHHTYGLQATISNCSNNYGPYQFPEKLIPLALTNMLRGREVPVYGDGRNIRDWIYVQDHSLGIDLVLQKGKPGEVYNLGGENEARNIEIVELLCEQLQQRFAGDSSLASRFPEAPASKGGSFSDLVRFVTDRPGHDWRYAIDSRKCINELGYEPAHSFASGLAHTIDWYLANEDWWQSVLDGSYQRISL